MLILSLSILNSKALMTYVGKKATNEDGVIPINNIISGVSIKNVINAKAYISDGNKNIYSIASASTQLSEILFFRSLCSLLYALSIKSTFSAIEQFQNVSMEIPTSRAFSYSSWTKSVRRSRFPASVSLPALQ